MAAGDFINYDTDPPIMAVCLLASTTALNSPPNDSADGIAIADLYERFGWALAPADVALVLFSTAGSDTLTVTARLWAYHPIGAGVWVPLGTGADADKGKLNEGDAIGETVANAIRHCEVISLVALAGTRVYLEITAIGGTATAVEAWLVVKQER